MDQMMNPEGINNIRTGYLDHVSVMFSVLEDVDKNRKGMRTSSLDNQNWENVQETYKGLDDDFKALLLLGIAWHDVGKTVRRLDHARLGALMIQALPMDEIIKENDILKKRKWKPENMEDAAEFLALLVEFHEIYGNFFTGEQSLLGFEPIMLRSYKELIKPFLDMLLILTVAEVGSQSQQGYLYNSRMERYAEAREQVLDRREIPQDQLRQELLAHGKDEKEVFERILGLAYSYSTVIDNKIETYRSTVKKAINGVMEEVKGNLGDFFPLGAWVTSLKNLTGQIQK